MSEYEFTLNYLPSSDDANPVELLERLGDGGCIDRSASGSRGALHLNLREALSRSGMHANQQFLNVKRAIPAATLINDGVQLNDFQIPDDFPRPQHLGAVPGAQPKFLAVEYNGRYYSPGCTPPEVFERWQHCMNLVPQFVSSCIETKKGKRAHMPEADILDQYLVRLIETGWVGRDEAKWVIREVALQLGWPTPEAAHGG